MYQKEMGINERANAQSSRGDVLSNHGQIAPQSSAAVGSYA